MLLTIDIGNTNITLGVYKETLLFESRMATDKSKMKDQYAIDMMDILKIHEVNPKELEGAIICSVVPSLDDSICEAVELISNIKPMLVGPGIKTGMNIRIDNPAQLGADLLVGAIAAREKYGCPCIVWDLGTATTISAVSKDGAYEGAIIMAGVKTSLNALVNNTSLLPGIRIEAPTNIIGKNTVESMQSGILYSTASIMDGMSKKLKRELGDNTKVIVTGGLGKSIVPHCESKMVYDENLILDGLYIIYNKNKKG